MIRKLSIVVNPRFHIIEHWTKNNFNYIITIVEYGKTNVDTMCTDIFLHVNI